MLPVTRIRSSFLARSVPVLALVLAVAPSATPQSFNNPWATFAKKPSALPASSLSSSTIEVDFTPGDLNLDGWPDLLVMRKEPFTKAGKRSQVLLMNEGGVLIDRTASYAVQSDVHGDLGFLTPTSTRHAAIADVNNDGWPDVITATAMGDNDPKQINHPRVYMNQGSSGGNWLGLRHEDFRIPQLKTTAGGDGVPHFVRVLTGDLNGDGFVDLYFVDHDDGVGGYHQKPGTDLDDRALINDGTGKFVDQTAAYFPFTMTQSTFGTSGGIVDINQDGKLDVIVSDTNGPNNAEAAYGNPSDPDDFSLYHKFYSGQAPYFIDLADLNNDGRLDLIAGDDGADRFLFNQGNDPLGRVIWSAAKSFQFLSGSDAEFTGQIRTADLDNDGWQDVVITDMDVDVASGGGHRTHIYHNPGGPPGSFNITPREERKSSSSSAGNWIGAVGLEATDLNDTYDVALFDFDKDGDVDMVFGRSSGVTLWENQLDPPTVCQQDLGQGGPGSSELSVCGQGLATGNSATLELTGAPASTSAWLAASATSNPTPLLGGTLVPFPLAVLVGPLPTNGLGELVLPGIPGGGGPFTVYVQALVSDPAQPAGLGFSNALKLNFLP